MLKYHKSITQNFGVILICSRDQHTFYSYNGGLGENYDTEYSNSLIYLLIV